MRTTATDARRAAALTAMALAGAALAGCGGSGDRAEDVVAETAAKLRAVESGVVAIRVRIDPKAENAQPLAIRLRGLFAFDDAGGLPVARVVYTEVRGGRRDTAALLATTRGAYAEVRGQAYELPAEQADRVERVRELLAEGDWRGRLGIDHWIEGADLADGGVVDGATMDRVAGTLDVTAAAEDLVELARAFGYTFGPVADVDPQAIEAATRSTAVRLFTGEHDRLLRRLEVEIDLGFDVPSPLRRTLGRLEGARIDFEVSVSDVNRPVRVAEPRSVRPSSELPSR